MKAIDRELKAVISILNEMANSGTLEYGQKEAISKSINALRRAARKRDPNEIRAAIALVARIFIRTQGQ
jgi:hypothetical protein